MKIREIVEIRIYQNSFEGITHEKLMGMFVYKTYAQTAWDDLIEEGIIYEFEPGLYRHLLWGKENVDTICPICHSNIHENCDPFNVDRDSGGYLK